MFKAGVRKNMRLIYILKGNREVILNNIPIVWYGDFIASDQVTIVGAFGQIKITGIQIFNSNDLIYLRSSWRVWNISKKIII